MAELQNEIITATINKNPIIEELAKLDYEGLKRRYVTKEKSVFKTGFLAAVNKKDENGMRVNYNMHAIRGKNLDLIGQQVYKIARRLERYEFYFNFDQLISDFERVLEDFEDNIMDDINNNNRNSAEPQLYVTLVTLKMMSTLTDLKNYCCYSHGNNSTV